jgi:hypothetical protein
MMSATDMETAKERRPEAPWLSLAFGSLLVAGGFALFLVFARLPPLSSWLGPAGFFKRCLVVHVDLAIVVWFHAFSAGLFALLPARRTVPGLRKVAAALAALGLLALLACVFVTGAQPMLTNYVPSLDHPLFYLGLGAFFAGVALSLLDGRLWPGNEGSAPSLLPPAARPGARTAALALLFAGLTFFAGLVSTPAGLLPETRNELLLWGPGHVLQISSVAAMLTVWLTLLERALQRAPVPRGVSWALFALLLLPAASAPALGLLGTNQVTVHAGFTRMMEWGIFPVVTVFGVLALKAVIPAVRERRVAPLSAPLVAFYASALLTAVGFVLGGVISGSNTTVPAHYHASIGAVTVSFMAMTYVVLQRRGLRPTGARLNAWARWQPALFGLGQAIFASGFALAGSQGMARKAYASEQHVRTALETLGLWVMGVGGLIAVSGGLLFITWVITAVWNHEQQRRTVWQPASTPFKP